MPEFAHKRCPRCGKRPLDARLVQCPDCRVPFEYDSAPLPAALTPAQLSVATKHVLGSWKLWLGLFVVVGGTTAGLIEFVNVKTQQLRDETAAIQMVDSNAIATKIDEGISNRIETEFQQPRIQAAIQLAASQKAGEILTNEVWASLDDFRAKMRSADEQLAKTTNDLANLSNTVHQAQAAAAQLATSVPGDPALLTLVNQTVTRSGTNYDLALFFKPSNTKPLGTVELVAGTYRQTARIINFTAQNADQVAAPVFNDIGDAAKLDFTVNRPNAPVEVDLVLSAPTLVKVTGDQLEEELTLPVAVDQMQLPMVNR